MFHGGFRVKHHLALCGLPISLSSTDMKSVNDRSDGLWVKTAKWFISQRRYVRKQSLTGSLISVMCQPCSLLVQTSFFIGFEPFRVRFKPYPVLVVQTDAHKDAFFRATGPMVTISVKSCATVADMRQNQDNIAFRRGSQLALQANCWTGYASPERTNRLSNHKIKGPPPLATQQQMEKALAPGQTLAFPPGGRVFQPGVIYRDLADNGLPACFGVVLPQSYEASFGQALAFHGTSAFPVLQMIWSDTRGTFPWEPSFEQRFQGQQQLLCDPSRFLPLKEETDTPS
jgi:hypothetical protein